MTRKTRRTHHQNRSYDAKNNEPIAITPTEYGGLQAAYDHFNTALFDGKLSDVFITYQRRAHSFGYFAPDRFSGRVDKAGNHKLALNPDGFINQTDEQVCQTLVHEQVHVWQHAFGKPSVRGYHNKEWSGKMKEVGLQPSSTGMVGGKETGAKMLDYIIPDGPFTKAFAQLAATGWKLNLQSAHRPGPKGGVNSKTKFTCSACGQNVWGKPDTGVFCKPCWTSTSKLVEMLAVDTAAIATPVPSYEATEQPMIAIVPSNEPSMPIETKHKRGRPLGSKNRPKRGRPKGSKNKPKAVVSYDVADRRVA